MRERVVGMSVEDDGEEVDGAGREFIVVAVSCRSVSTLTVGCSVVRA